MKCISLWQPWASLMVLGHKRIETRSWPMPKTLAGQRVLIHAAKHWAKDLAAVCLEEPFKSMLRTDASDLPRGAILGWVKFDRCTPTDKIAPSLAWQEHAFGDYSPGRWAWRTLPGEHHALRNPIPHKGHQGVFDVADSISEGAAS